MPVAKVFKSGNSQAVRLPRELRFPDGVSDLDVRREGELLILAPRRPRTFSRAFLDSLGSLPAFERPVQKSTRRKRMFP